MMLKKEMCESEKTYGHIFYMLFIPSANIYE